jgi:hypothetical protein
VVVVPVVPVAGVVAVPVAGAIELPVAGVVAVPVAGVVVVVVAAGVVVDELLLSEHAPSASMDRAPMARVRERMDRLRWLSLPA